MKSKLLLMFGIVLLVLVSFGSASALDWFWCYQETANESTGCGGLSSGGYYANASNPDLSNVTDGDWDTYLNLTSNLFFNYTIPNKWVNGSSKIQIKINGTTTNYTIPSTCGVIDNNLLFRYRVHVGYYLLCSKNGSWGGVSTTLLNNFGSSEDNRNLYEEAMWWNISNAIPNQPTLNNPINNSVVYDNQATLNITVTDDNDDYLNVSFYNRRCYQETANESTGCGGLDTGNYNIIPEDTGTEYLMTDKDWSSYGNLYSGATGYGTFYVNYSLHDNVDSATWQIKEFKTRNASINDTCLKDPVELKYYIYTPIGGPPIITHQCYNGSEWINLTIAPSGGIVSGRFYEEAMWWNITSSGLGGGWVNDSFVPMTGTLNWSNVTKTINSTIGIDYAWCVHANDTTDNWNSTSCVSPFSYTSTSSITDTCTCPASGDWYIECSDNCNIQACDMQTNNVLINGTGTAQGLRNITNAVRIRIQGGCTASW